MVLWIISKVFSATITQKNCSRLFWSILYIVSRKRPAPKKMQSSFSFKQWLTSKQLNLKTKLLRTIWLALWSKVSVSLMLWLQESLILLVNPRRDQEKKKLKIKKKRTRINRKTSLPAMLTLWLNSLICSIHRKENLRL